MRTKIIQTSFVEIKKNIDEIETDQIVLICDQNIKQIYTPLVDELISFSNKQIFSWTSLPGEKTKTLEEYVRCVDYLLSHGLHRRAHIISLGGGSTSDFSGFVAATLLRGISWSIIPTTLLSQVDASIGGKTGINSKYGKNLIGSFYYPEKIFLCKEFLITLEKEEHDSGLGEVVKYAFLSKDILN